MKRSHLKRNKSLQRKEPIKRARKKLKSRLVLKVRSLTKAERVEQMKRDGYLCRDCGIDVAWAAAHLRSTIEAARATSAWIAAPYSQKPEVVAYLSGLDISLAVAVMRKGHEVPAEIDHIIPRELQGTNDPENLQTLCCQCHKAKSRDDVTAISNAASHRRSG